MNIYRACWSIVDRLLRPLPRCLVGLAPTSQLLINDALGLGNGVADRLLWVSMGFSPDKVFGANFAIDVPFDISFGSPPIGALAGSRNDGAILVFDCSVPACGGF